MYMHLSTPFSVEDPSPLYHDSHLGAMDICVVLTQRFRIVTHVTVSHCLNSGTLRVLKFSAFTAQGLTGHPSIVSSPFLPLHLSPLADDTPAMYASVQTLIDCWPSLVSRFSA